MSFVPNTTPTPNWLYNGEMKKMNETELKVVLLITRKTLGWFDPMTKDRKMQDYISQSQFIEFTGQKSNTSIANAIQRCVEHGWIVAKDRDGNICDSPEKRARRKIWYQLGTVFTNKISGTENAPDENESGTENASHLVQKVDSTKETTTKERLRDFPSENELSSFDGEIRIVPDGEEKEPRAKADPKVKQIAEAYMEHKKFVYKTAGHKLRDLARNMKTAKKLVEFTGPEIYKCIEFCEEKFGDMWTLETVEKQMSNAHKS